MARSTRGGETGYPTELAPGRISTVLEETVTREKGRPPISAEIIALIEEMAVKNRTWRAPRIKGELLKLGIVVHADTVKKYMRRARKGLPPGNQGQTWATFIKNHAGEMWACDFLQTYDLFFRAVFVYLIIELGSRRIVQYVRGE